MRYKVGDEVRVRGDLEVGKEYGNNAFVEEMEEYRGKVAEIEEGTCSGYSLGSFGCRYYWTSEMLRPSTFKIWCETEKEKHAVIEELEKEGYVWSNGKKPTKWHGIYDAPMCLVAENDKLLQGANKKLYPGYGEVELTPSEFTGIDFSKKIIITKTPTGATATYGDKTAMAEGDFDDASRQALAEVLCPFKVGDEVKSKLLKIHGKVENVQIDGKITVGFSNDSSMNCFDYELEPYTEPSYNAKLFCIEGHGVFKQGVVYTVENGIFTGVYVSHFKDLDDINKNLIAQFMEIKGGLDD